MEFDIEEKPEFGWRVADDTDVEFYTYFDISPIALLADCSFSNLANLGLEDGYDICFYEDGIEGGCPKCEYNKPKHLWYPPITDQIIINMLLITGTIGLNLPYYNYEQKPNLYKWLKQKAQDDTIRQKIRNILTGEVQEWSRQ